MRKMASILVLVLVFSLVGPYSLNASNLVDNSENFNLDSSLDVKDNHDIPNNSQGESNTENRKIDNADDIDIHNENIDEINRELELNQRNQSPLPNESNHEINNKDKIMNESNNEEKKPLNSDKIDNGEIVEPTSENDNDGTEKKNLYDQNEIERTLPKQMLKISSQVIEESVISRLGHLNSENVKIYKEIGVPSTAFTAGTTYTHAVYYIKKQTIVDGVTYYQISEKPSSSIVGWVKAEDLSSASHKVVDKEEKTFYIKGTGSAYSKAWGGKQDYIYENLSNYKDQVFKVHLTESVDGDNWYRGSLNGKTVWIHPSYLSTNSNIKESKISRLGHLNSENVKIYKEVGVPSTAFTAGTTYTHAVYYIKKQTVVDGVTYYQISEKPSSSIVGWVKAEDLSSASHKVVDKEEKIFYIKGTGSAYSKAWGGKQDYIYENLSTYKGQVFKVHLTESVDGDNWYRGSLNGKTLWIHPKYVTAGKEGSTSKLGHLKSENVKVYKEIGVSSTSFTAGTTYTNAVYYIKKQAVINDQTYYLISKNPSSTKGVVGWVKAEDLSLASHKVIDKNEKTFYIKGTGSAYSKAWGGKQDYVYENLSTYKDRVFKVHLTESVNGDDWYRGSLNGKTVWIHPKYVTAGEENKISRLGHLNSANVEIYKEIGVPSSAFTAGTTYTHAVYYIKKQVEINGKTYYLISKNPSSTTGVVGWVKAEEMSTASHVVVDKKEKTFYIKGTGNAYSKAWGGKKDYVYEELSKFKDREFKVHLTESVGGDIWYRGTLDGNTIWINNKYVTQFNYSYYDLTLEQALAIQMAIKNPPPQTDKYRNSPAYISGNNLKMAESATIYEDANVKVRTSPKLIDSNHRYTLSPGTKVTIKGIVEGDAFQGSTIWYQISYNGETLYAHSYLVNANITTNLDVRAAPNSNNSTHVYGVIQKGTQVSLIKKHGSWYEISYNAWRNATSSDTKAYLNPDSNDAFQHLDLSSSSGATAIELNYYLKGKGILDGMGEAFIDAGKAHNVNELYLISHALLETKNGTSNLATGINVNGKVVYNMFGVNAFDHCADSCGSQKAYDEGWDNPYKAIVGGAKFIGQKYIHNNYKQNTIYKMRWNPDAMEATGVFGTQYATDIGWASKQVRNLKNMYAKLKNPLLKFNIVKYK